MRGVDGRWATPILHQMVKQSLDEIATAVASVPRRAIIERLAEGDASMSALADHLTVSLPAVDKHLRVLVDAGMVTKQKHGRTTSVRLVPGSLEESGHLGDEHTPDVDPRPRPARATPDR